MGPSSIPLLSQKVKDTRRKNRYFPYKYKVPSIIFKSARGYSVKYSGVFSRLFMVDTTLKILFNSCSSFGFEEIRCQAKKQ